VSLGKTLNAVSHLGPSSLPIEESSLSKDMQNKTASVLEWYDKHRVQHLVQAK